jgi:hypothetical protein
MARLSGSGLKHPRGRAARDREAHFQGSISLLTAFIFAEDEIETVRSLQVGEAISVAGELTVELSEWNGESRLNWKITADAVLSARAKPKQAKLQDGKPASHLPPSSNDSRQPFDTKRWEGGPAHQIADDIPFMWEGR